MVRKNEVNEQELNKKLAEWAGFVICWEEGATDGLCHYPDEPDYQMRKSVPDFTQSLDACFDWLIPMLKKKLKYEENDFALWKFVEDWSKEWVLHRKEAALTFCLAIMRVMDNEFAQ